MSGEHPQSTQHIDENLMESLDKLKTPSSEPSQWFPAEKEKGLHLVFSKPKSETEQTEQHPIKPEPTNQEQGTTSSVPAAASSPKTSATSPNASILYLPGVLFLGLAIISIITKLFGLPFIPPQLELVLCIVLAVANAPCIIILSLLHAAYLRETYVYAGLEIKESSLKKDFFLPVALGLWPLAIGALLAIILFAIPVDQSTLATLFGFTVFLFIAGPLAVILAISQTALAVLYRRGNSVEYPSFIYGAIGWSWQTFNKKGQP